jgi:hypothetical protein
VSTRRTAPRATRSQILHMAGTTLRDTGEELVRRLMVSGCVDRWRRVDRAKKRGDDLFELVETRRDEP